MAAYEAARAKAGRDADAHVRLALWCESHGLEAERLKHLAIAVLADPSHATARGLMGLVAYRGGWRSPEAVSAQVGSDREYAAALASYNGRRARMGDSADAHWKMALWCEQQGLKPEATAHLTRVVQLEPGREAAWKHLGYRKQGRRWVTDEQLAAEKAEAEAQKEADRHWPPILSRWRGWIGDKTREVELAEALATVTDPRAVPSVWATFGRGKASHQKAAVQLLGQIDSPDSTRGPGPAGPRRQVARGAGQGHADAPRPRPARHRLAAGRAAPRPRARPRPDPLPLPAQTDRLGFRRPHRGSSSVSGPAVRRLPDVHGR